MNKQERKYSTYLRKVCRLMRLENERRRKTGAFSQHSTVINCGIELRVKLADATRWDSVKWRIATTHCPYAPSHFLWPSRGGISAATMMTPISQPYPYLFLFILITIAHFYSFSFVYNLLSFEILISFNIFLLYFQILQYNLHCRQKSINIG